MSINGKAFLLFGSGKIQKRLPQDLRVATKIGNKKMVGLKLDAVYLFPINLFTFHQAIDGMSTSGPVKSGILGRWHQVRDPITGILVVGWETRGKNHGINCYTAMPLGYAVPFWLERKDMKNENKFAKD